MDLAAPVLWKSIRSLSKRDTLHVLLWAHQLRIWEQWVPGTDRVLSVHVVMQAQSSLLGQSQGLRWWTELWSPRDLPIQAAWSGSWANINTQCCLSFSGYFYIVNKKPQGLFSGPRANWPSLVCISTATVTLTEECECIPSTTGKGVLAWVLSCRVPGCSNQSGVTQLLRF